MEQEQQPQGHWTESVAHPKLATPETKEAFTKVYSKYATQEDALLGGLDAIRMTGKPFKLPESLDRLPDDNVRKQFLEEAGKVKGLKEAFVGAPATAESLKDVDFREGLPEGAAFSDADLETYKQFIVQEGIPKDIAVKLNNMVNTVLVPAVLERQQQVINQQREETNQALIKHFGSEEKVAEQTELLKRAFKDHAGLTAEEYEQVGTELDASGMVRSALLARALMTMLAPLAKEGTQPGGEGGNKPAPKLSEYETRKARWPKSPQLWGSPDR